MDSTSPSTASPLPSLVTAPYRVRLPILTDATSLTRRTRPFADFSTTCSRSCGVWIAPSALTTSVFSPSFSLPAPSFLLFAAMASARSVMPRPAAVILALSGRTSKTRTSPPSELTSATPGMVRSAGRIVQSSRVRFSSRDSLSPSTVNMKTSDSGVETGASPPETLAGSSPRTLARRSDTCWRAQ